MKLKLKVRWVSIEMPLPSFIFRDISITENTYYKMGGVAQYFARPTGLSEVQKTLLFCRENQIPCALLGSGSNSVYADGYFAGLILSLERFASWHWECDDTLYVEAGVTNTEIAEICAAASRAGASWMYRMPGQIGATVRMNARCYGGEISQIVTSVVAINPQGELLTYPANTLFQGYKKTLFMDEPHVVVGVRLFFPQSQEASILVKHMHECEADRHSKKHFYLPSCGSTFKNNYELGKPSGQLFDELGLKGKKWGEVEVSLFHANFLWNCGFAKTIDMLNLAAFMRAQVWHKLGARVELEVQPVGCFEKELFDACGMENLGCYFTDEQAHEKKWTGLFYFPRDNRAVSSTKYPYVLLQAPFLEYHQTNLRGLPCVTFSLTQLQSFTKAQQNPTTPFLKWETHCLEPLDTIFPLKPIPTQDNFIDNLWHYSVSEVFFAHAARPEHYLEFEATPMEQWVSLKFDGSRQRVAEEFKPPVQILTSFAPSLSLAEASSGGSARPNAPPNSSVFGMAFSYQDLQHVLGENNFILVQGALSLGQSHYLLAPYWKFENRQQESPDFHQPQRFWKCELKN